MHVITGDAASAATAAGDDEYTSERLYRHCRV